MAIVSTVYMRLFLPDSVIHDNLSTPIMSNEKVNVTQPIEGSPKKMEVFKTMPSLGDVLTLLKSRSVNLPFLLFIPLECKLGRS